MKNLLILLICAPFLFCCEAVSDSFGTTYIDRDIYVKINVTQHDLADNESKITNYTATIESVGTFDFYSGEKFLLLSDGGYNLVEYPQVPVYNKLTDDITITDDFLSGEKIIVSSSYKYGVANNGGQNIYYGVTSLDLSGTIDLQERGVDVYKVIKNQLFNVSFYGGDINKVDTLYATLSGIAQRWNLTNNCPEGDASTIELPFLEPIFYDYYSEVRLLGVDTLQRQYATITVKFKDNEIDDIIKTFDITSQMENFNDDKSASAELITFSIEIPESEPIADTYLQIEVTSELTEDDIVPTDFTGIIENNEYSFVNNIEFLLNDITSDKSVKFYVYSDMGDNLTFKNNLATDGTIVATSTSDYGVAGNLSQHLFYGSSDVDIICGNNNVTDVYGQRMTKELVFMLNVTGELMYDVKSVTTTMSGVGQSWDLVSNCPYGASSTINIPLNDYYFGSASCSIKLLGVDTTEKQLVTVTITYNDNSFQTEIFDVTDKLSTFNDRDYIYHDAIELNFQTN